MFDDISVWTWLGFIGLYVINDLFAIWYYNYRRKAREKDKLEKFLRAVQLEYPDARLTFIAIESSDEVAMARLERDIRANRYKVSQQVERDQ